MFDASSIYYDVFYDFLDYQSATDNLKKIITQFHPNAITLLDVGCGSGRHLKGLMQDYEVAGLDINSTLLDLAKMRCPSILFYEADMVNFDLSKKFDVITCLFCSVAYVKTVAQLARSIGEMAKHLNFGGVLIIEPWLSPKTYWPKHLAFEVSDKPEMKLVRMYSHELHEGCSLFNIHYLIGTPQGVTHFIEREELGLFSQQEYEMAFEQAGLKVNYLDKGLFPNHKYGLFIGQKI